MEWFEEHAIQTYTRELRLWKRYVDDTIVAMQEVLLDHFTGHINSIDENIEFTREDEVERTIPMLDAKTSRESDGSLSFTVYRKPTHTDHYLQFSSHQPLQHKLGVIRTLKHRCETICSTEEAKLQEIQHLQKVLSVSGYTKDAWNLASHRKPPLPAPTVDRELPQQKGRYITLPYLGRTSDALAARIRKAGVAVHAKPTNTLRSRLVHPKDKMTPGEKAGTVYHIKCGDCEAEYVGETERQLNVRIKEHQTLKSSHVFKHLKETDHKFDSTEDVKLLHTESNWFKRGVAESIKILQHGPSINRDGGRHKLPVLYREVLLARDLDHVQPQQRIPPTRRSRPEAATRRGAESSAL